MAVDGSGNVFVAGYSYAAGSSYNYLVLAYSAAGPPLWTNLYNGPSNGDDRATAVAVDAGGNVFVTGYSAGPGGYSDYLTIAYSNGGVPLWTIVTMDPREATTSRRTGNAWRSTGAAQSSWRAIRMAIILQSR